MDGSAESSSDSRSPVTVALLLAAAVVFTGASLACAIVRHNSAVVTDGLSWYAAHRPTVVPFIAAMALVAALLLIVAQRIDTSSREGALTRWAVTIIAVLLLGVLATPYTVNTYFNWTHVILGGTLFAVQFALTAWLVWRNRSPLVCLLGLCQLVAGLLALFSLIGVVDVLLYAQIVFQLVFLAELPWLLPGTARAGRPGAL